MIGFFQCYVIQETYWNRTHTYYIINVHSNTIYA